MKHNICPWYIGYFLASPIRRLLYNPGKILTPHLRPGAAALDIGSGMGFFTLPMAELVGEQGSVIAVDLQPQMLKQLKARAAKRRLIHRIKLQLCNETSLNIEHYLNGIDFALMFAVVHELPDARKAFQEVYETLTPEGLLLFAEPDKHVSKKHFEQSVSTAVRCGFTIADKPVIAASHAVLLQK